MSEQTVRLPPVSCGDVLAGKYLVERVLGVGGMGVVVAVIHMQLEERFAIKFLLPEITASPEAVARFAREARAAIKIKSEHVARTVDVGTLENGGPYIVMEYLDGTDLGAILAAQGPLPIKQAVDFILHACEAVAEAHAIGIIHRDLKPANLFVIEKADGTKSVKVLDFGISKTTNLSVTGSGPDLQITKTSSVLGSPVYMPPEQMSSPRNVDERSDIWAIGATLYELLTGGPPFTADTIPELCTKVLMHPTPSLLARRPDAPAGLEAAIFRCMQKDPASRYPNVSRLAAALAEFGTKQSRYSAERISLILRKMDPVPNTLASPPSSTEPATGVAHRSATPPGPVGTPGQAGVLASAVVLPAGGALSEDSGGTHRSWEHSGTSSSTRGRVALPSGLGLIGLVVAAAAAVWTFWPNGDASDPLEASTTAQEQTAVADEMALPEAAQVSTAASVEAATASSAPASASASAPPSALSAGSAQVPVKASVPVAEQAAAKSGSYAKRPPAPAAQTSRPAAQKWDANRKPKGDIFNDRY